jgi:hypothetical protein
MRRNHTSCHWPFAALLVMCSSLVLYSSAVHGAGAFKVAAEYATPLSFEANRGQTHPEVQFLARGRGYTIFLTSSGAVLSLRPDDLQANKTAMLRMKLVGTNPAALAIGLGEVPEKSNYFLGNVTGKWHSNVPAYARVKYGEVYPGIDLVYYASPARYP